MSWQLVFQIIALMVAGTLCAMFAISAWKNR